MTKARGIWAVTPASWPSIETAEMARDQFLPWIRALEKGQDLSGDVGRQTIHNFERMVSFLPWTTAPTTIGNPLRFGTLAGPPPGIRVPVTIAGAPKEEQEGWLSAIGVGDRLIPLQSQARSRPVGLLQLVMVMVAWSGRAHRCRTVFSL
jgi:hypothetical protein